MATSKKGGAPVVVSKKRDKHNKNRKYGRNKKWCASYRAACRRERNRARRIKRHCRRYPNDQAAAALV
jgi:hypothetical protein